MLLQFREYIGSFLRVEAEMKENYSPKVDCAAVVIFQVTNTAPAHEYYPEIVYEEVRLKVGVPPDWHVKTVENLVGGQSFTYNHYCNSGEIAGIQWTVEGRISPSALLHFRRRPVDIKGDRQLSVKAYFDYLAGMEVFKKLEAVLKDMGTPAEGTSLEEIAGEIADEVQRIDGFLEFIDMGEYRNNIIKHTRLVQGQLEKTGQEVEGLIRKMEDCRAGDFVKVRDKILAGLAGRMGKLKKSARSLAGKVGVEQAELPESLC